MRTVFLSVALLVAAPAFAEDGPNIVIPEVTEVDFDGVDVNASLYRPGTILVTESRRPPFSPFITLRPHFSAEMSASLSHF